MVQTTNNKQTNKTKKQTETSICKIGKSNQVNAAEVVIDYELSTIKSAKTTKQLLYHILPYTTEFYNTKLRLGFRYKVHLVVGPKTDAMLFLDHPLREHSSSQSGKQ